jgi:hypothetical protein
MAYYQFQGLEGPYGSFETIHDPDNRKMHRRGWYWQACFPGCLPDGDMYGPFATEQEAIEDAQDDSIVIRNVPSLIATVLIEPEHVLIEGPVQDNEGHYQVLAFFMHPDPGSVHRRLDEWEAGQ